MLSSVIHAWRSWKSAKPVALLAIAALAVGIGSTTAIYTVVDSVLLTPLPYRNGDRFVSLFGANVNEPGGWFGNSWLNLLDYRNRTRSFDAFGIYQPREFNLTSPGAPQHLTAVEVTPSLANSLGVSPVVGRWFQEASADTADDTADVAVISVPLWQRLGGSPGIVGQSLTLDGRRYTVTGIAPASFRFPVSGTNGEEIRADVWVPLNPQGGNRGRGNAVYFCYARLRPGVTLAQGDADVKRAAAQIAKEHPGDVAKGYTASIVNVRDDIVHQIRPTLLLLLGAAGILLLITCANVAGLLLARSVTRARETAVRVALGATQMQLAVQYFAEGLLISLAGAAGGVLFSFALVRFVLTLAADYVPRADEIAVNWQALSFALVTGIFGSLLFSLAPLWQARRTLPNEVLSDGARTSAPARSRRLSRSLVVAEIALAFVLLSLSALLLANLSGLLRLSPGFDPNGLVTFAINTSDIEYPKVEQRAPYQARMMRAIARVPGVTGAAFVNELPLSGCCFSTGIAPESASWSGGTEGINMLVASPGYLRAMRIPLLAGRFFDDAIDTSDKKEPSMVIDRAAAKRYWPRGDAVGSYARLGNEGKDRARVIGIIGDIRHEALAEAPRPAIYFSASQVGVNPMRVVVRSPLPLDTLAPQLRAAIQGVNRLQPSYLAATMNDVIRGSIVTERLQSFLTGFFAFAALLMAALGVYGVVSYSVRHRTVEIGTRMALGAIGRDVMRLILGDGLRLAALGIGIGALAVTATVLGLRSEVFGIHVADLRPFLYSTGIVAGFSTLACFFPALRATMVSPMVAIRDDPGSILRNGSARLRRLFDSITADDEYLDEGALLSGFVDATRRASSFREATELALTNLCKAIRCESIRLFESPGPLLSERLRNYGYPLPLNASDFESWTRWAEVSRPDALSEIAALRETGVRLAVPLLARNEISGVLLLGDPLGRERYNHAERRALRACASQFALMLENARLTGRMIEQEKLRRDVQLASEVQKRLFPDKPPVSAGVALAGTSLPARGVGGDYYDFLDLGNGRIGIALADVAGKGVAAALIMSVVQASLRILAVEEGITLSSLAEKMNRYLHRSTRSSGYATFFYAEVDERHRRLRYVNAGHNPPFLMRYSTTDELPAGGTVIGLFPQSSYEEASVDLDPGDVLLAFTDGVPEALNPRDEEFGEDRLRDLLRRCGHLPVEDMAARIGQELKSWIADADQYDDLTFILLKVNSSLPA